MEIHTNGSIYYLSEPSILIFDMWNGTIYEVKTDKFDQIKSVFQRYYGDIIEAQINNKKAAVIDN